MAELFLSVAAALGGGGASAATVAVPGIAGLSTLVPAAPAVASGISLASVLQGTATVLGVVASIGAGNAEGAGMELQADDADREQPLETLQGIQRRASIKRQLAEATGELNTAYAASGVDLSWGTAASARQDAFREADLALSADAGTQSVRQSRLAERAANYRAGAKRMRAAGWINGLSGALQG